MQGWVVEICVRQLIRKSLATAQTLFTRARVASPNLAHMHFTYAICRTILHELCYTTLRNFAPCFAPDGGLNGTCNINVACHDSNTVCNTSTNRCQCVTGYAPTNGTCYKGMKSRCRIQKDAFLFLSMIYMSLCKVYQC